MGNGGNGASLEALVSRLGLSNRRPSQVHEPRWRNLTDSPHRAARWEWHVLASGLREESMERSGTLRLQFQYRYRCSL